MDTNLRVRVGNKPQGRRGSMKAGITASRQHSELTAPMQVRFGRFNLLVVERLLALGRFTGVVAGRVKIDEGLEGFG